MYERMDEILEKKIKNYAHVRCTKYEYKHTHAIKFPLGNVYITHLIFLSLAPPFPPIIKAGIFKARELTIRSTVSNEELQKNTFDVIKGLQKTTRC